MPISYFQDKNLAPMKKGNNMVRDYVECPHCTRLLRRKSKLLKHLELKHGIEVKRY